MDPGSDWLAHPPPHHPGVYFLVEAGTETGTETGEARLVVNGQAFAVTSWNGPNDPARKAIQQKPVPIETVNGRVPRHTAGLS